MNLFKRAGLLLAAQMAVAGALAYGLYRAFPVHGVGHNLTLGRFLHVLFHVRDPYLFFELSLVLTGVLIVLFWLIGQAQFQGHEALFFIGLFGVLIPIFVFQRLNHPQRLMACAAALFPVPLGVLIKSGSRGKSEDWVRGTELMPGGQAHKFFAKLLKEAIKSGDSPGIAFWDGARLPRSKETQHILLAGSTGSGKTQIMYPMIEEVMARGDKIVLWDVKGTYLQAFLGRPGVTLLAPWDSRSAAWAIGKDIHNSLDCGDVAKYIIPDPKSDHNVYFERSARELLSQAMKHLEWEAHQKQTLWGWSDLWKEVGLGPQRLSLFLKRSEPGRGLSEGILQARSGPDVYSTLKSHLSAVDSLAQAWPKEGMSLRQWMREESGPQVLILGGTARYSQLAGATANLAIQMMAHELMSMSNNLERRRWFFLDEMASLGRIEAITQLSTLGREKGACIVAGIQDIGTLEKLYGYELTKSIANTFTTTIFLRCADVATSQWAADVIGKQEVIETRQSWSEGSHSGRGGDHANSGWSNSSSSQEVSREKHVFMHSQIANFKDLEGLFRLAGWPVAHLGWPRVRIEQTTALIEEAPWIHERPKLDVLPDLPEEKEPLNKDADRKDPPQPQGPEWGI